MDRLRELERLQDDEDELAELQLLNEQARLPGRVGWLAERRRQFLLTGEAPRIKSQPWFNEVIQEQLEYWLKVEGSCEPANRQTAEQAISGFYRRLELGCPEFVWGPSPRAIHRIISTSNFKFLRPVPVAALYEQVTSQLNSLLNEQIWDGFDDQVWNHFWDRAYWEMPLEAEISNRFIKPAHWGSGDANWIGSYMTARKLGVCYRKEDLDLLKEWDTLAHSCFWWWPYDEVCFISDRPREIQFNENGRLTKCIFRDGWGIENE